MKQNNFSENNHILLFDSSMKFEDVYTIIKEKKPKIITFDYESNKLFEQKNIPHEVSDMYVSKSDLEFIQDKSYLFAQWFDDPLITNFIQYDGINIGELFFVDFHYKLIPLLKKFFEIIKLFEFNKNSTYIASFSLYDIITCFTDSVIKIEISNIDSNYDNAIKIPIRFGKFSYSIKLKHAYLQKLKNKYEFFQNILLRNKPIFEKHITTLFIDFTTRKYNYIFSILPNFSIKLVKFDRTIPAFWNFESYSIITKSNCLIENRASLIDKSLKNSIKSGISLLKDNTDLLWKQKSFFESFFSINDKSFWKVIKPILVKQYEQKALHAVQEIEFTKKLFKKYNFNSILIWSESSINHLVAIKLAKKQNIPVLFIQHGLYFDNVENINYNKFFRVLPKYADKFLVWGNILKQYAIKLGFPENKIKIIGSPLHDNIFLTKNKCASSSDFILLATSSPFQNISQDLTVDVIQHYFESIKKICEVVSKSGKKLVIKLHPQPDEFDITDLAKKIDPRIIVIKAGDITQLIKSCEVFITIDISTSILEAQILEKPVISFKHRTHLDTPEIIKSNSCISATMDDFEKILTQILTDKKFKDELIERGIEFSTNYLSNMGSASQHLLDFLENPGIINDKKS